MVSVIDMSMGNLRSVTNALDFLNIPNQIVQTAQEIESAEKLILPGVGAFGQAMRNLTNSGCKEAIISAAQIRQVPLLGICLGMQLLLDSSEELGNHKGLGLISGKVLNFKNVISDLPIPHVGWNTATITTPNDLIRSENQAKDYYFVHSYYCELDNSKDCLARTSYGIEFDSALQKENIYGAQFHPEKSQKDGLSILVNFSKI